MKTSTKGLARRAAAYSGAGAGLLCLAALLFGSTALRAQQARPGAPARPQNARTEAPFDPSGYWVSVITQNWRFRMIVPGPGEYADLPINMKAKQLADAWKAVADEAAGKQCEAYGAAVIMRLPERLHISWQDDNDLRVDTDSGMQTRVLHFEPAPGQQITASLQGYSVARWDLNGVGGFFGRGGPQAGPRYGAIQINTDHMLPGLLRKNGVPYSDQTRMTEYWDLRTVSPGEQWLSISTRVQDPVYLQGPFIYDSIFKKEADGSKWDPTACTLRS
ncbi:MAG TPA: hypothetical protein VHX52_01425 [Steroidobacteraceae bacterium]|nr:hypothetical protein [Steroidobacteraceae bacterium]